MHTERECERYMYIHIYTVIYIYRAIGLAMAVGQDSCTNGMQNSAVLFVAAAAAFAAAIASVSCSVAAAVATNGFPSKFRAQL